MKVLVVCQGLERDRILAAISVHAPSKVIVLRSHKDVTPMLHDEVEMHIKALKKEIFPEKNPRPFPFVYEVDAENYRVDFFDLTKALTEICAIIKKERDRGNEVEVDVSSGNKIVAIALFLASQIFRIPATYCTAGKYASMKMRRQRETLPMQIAFSTKEKVDLPLLPLTLEDVHFDILKVLSREGIVPSVTELIELLGREPNKSEIVSTSRKLEDLGNYGYIAKRRIGRSTRVRITHTGKKVASLADLPKISKW